MHPKLQELLCGPAVEKFCRRWQVAELAAFGSVLRSDFGPGSDVDLLVSFEEGAQRTLFDLARMRLELRELLGREVDLVSRRAVESSRNPLRRDAILSTALVVYAA